MLRPVWQLKRFKTIRIREVHCIEKTPLIFVSNLKFNKGYNHRISNEEITDIAGCKLL